MSLMSLASPSRYQPVLIPVTFLAHHHVLGFKDQSDALFMWGRGDGPIFNDFESIQYVVESLRMGEPGKVSSFYNHNISVDSGSKVSERTQAKLAVQSLIRYINRGIYSVEIPMIIVAYGIVSTNAALYGNPNPALAEAVQQAVYADA